MSQPKMEIASLLTSNYQINGNVRSKDQNGFSIEIRLMEKMETSQGKLEMAFPSKVSLFHQVVAAST